VEPLDMEKKAASPGMVGYVVGKGDTLWSIARRYYATTDSIRRINELSDDDIKEGDRLLIMKS
jgi:LysM repeat protein